jgi:nitric oxide reductase large subunit
MSTERLRNGAILSFVVSMALLLIGGPFLMFSTGLLPIGLLQVWYSYDVGFWFARSTAFYGLPLVQVLGNWRIVPDTILIVFGASSLLWFLITTFPRLRSAGLACADVDTQSESAIFDEL